MTLRYSEEAWDTFLDLTSGFAAVACWQQMFVWFGLPFYFKAWLYFVSRQSSVVHWLEY